MAEYAVTTMDNPWNPFTYPDEWLDWDTKYGYSTNEWLALYALTSSSLDDETNEHLVNDGVNDFLAANPLGIHYKVYKEEANVLIPLANEAFLKMENELLQTNPTTSG